MEGYFVAFVDPTLDEAFRVLFFVEKVHLSKVRRKEGRKGGGGEGGERERGGREEGRKEGRKERDEGSQ
jgi:hypothetical protein